jgi:hypothetical protein
MVSSEYGKDLQIDGVTVVYQITWTGDKVTVDLVQVGQQDLKKLATQTKQNFINKILSMENPQTLQEKIDFLKRKKEEKMIARNCDHTTSIKLENKVYEELRQAGFDEGILTQEEKSWPFLLSKGIGILKNNRQSI